MESLQPWVKKHFAIVEANFRLDFPSQLLKERQNVFPGSVLSKHRDNGGNNSACALVICDPANPFVVFVERVPIVFSWGLHLVICGEPSPPTMLLSLTSPRLGL